ncbi:hypothetical protein GWK47_041582 [Chionoecetes opilio]|uniref:Uncharacterized protein n=1 Tax=Chionoecetes opilio TaxID=41210 RepID=A0A8J5CK75_CHIOP|nr:hypothetical protein GWK47_041582 [Chionoecetes opilio]
MRGPGVSLYTWHHAVRGGEGLRTIMTRIQMDILAFPGRLNAVKQDEEASHRKERLSPKKCKKRRKKTPTEDEETQLTSPASGTLRNTRKKCQKTCNIQRGREQRSDCIIHCSEMTAMLGVTTGFWTPGTTLLRAAEIRQHDPVLEAAKA